MNTANIAILYRFYFKRWNFSRDMIYDATETVTYEDGLTTTEYHLSDIFVQNVCDIRDKHSFYQFCRALNKNRPLQDTAREKRLFWKFERAIRNMMKTIWKMRTLCTIGIWLIEWIFF